MTISANMSATLQRDIVNATIPHATFGASRTIRLSNQDQTLADAGLDSLDSAIIGAYLCELFDVPLEHHREIPVDRLDTMFSFLLQYGRRILQSGAEVDLMLASSP